MSRAVAERLIKAREPMLNPLKAITRRMKPPNSERPRCFVAVPERAGSPAGFSVGAWLFLRPNRALCQILSCRRIERRAINQTVRDVLIGWEPVMTRERHRDRRQPRKRSPRGSYRW